MPATGYAVLLLVTCVVLGIAAVVRRSRRLVVLTGVSFALFVGYTGFLFPVVIGM